jgi:prepilin-type N-terminal cleavage/methylation domain-containing protein
MKIKKENSGFTLVEIVITVTIIVVLSATVAISIKSYVLERRGEVAAVSFYSQLQLMRGFAQRDNVRYLVKLNPKPKIAFQIFKDVKPSDYVCDDDEIVTLFPDQESVSQSIKIGRESGVSDLKVSSPFTDPSGDIVGEWKKQEKLKVRPDTIKADGSWKESDELADIENIIIFENDEIGSINSGIIYLTNTYVKNIGYAIVRPKEINVITMYKWNGHGWSEL